MAGFLAVSHFTLDGKMLIFLEELFVAKEHRREGVGLCLVARALRRPSTFAGLVVRKSKALQPARALYEALGFEVHPPPLLQPGDVQIRPGRLEQYMQVPSSAARENASACRFGVIRTAFLSVEELRARFPALVAEAAARHAPGGLKKILDGANYGVFVAL